MKRFYLITLVALSAAMAMSARTTAVYIVPFHSDGTVVQEGDTYPEAVPMTLQADGSYSADNVTLDFGFMFYMKSESGTTLYKQASWAVSPAVEILPNPLVITTQEAPIAVTAGTYDVSLYDKEQSGHTYKLFTLTPVERDRTYPGGVYLIYGSGSAGMQELTGDGTGLYKGVLNTNQPFVISYEPRNTEIYLFGPTSGGSIDLEEGIKVPIAYAKGTEAKYTYSQGRQTAPEITVSLIDGDSYVLLGADPGSTIVNEVAAAPESPEQSEYYTLSGTIVARTPSGHAPTLAAGIYIVRTGNNVSKRFIAR